MVVTAAALIFMLVLMVVATAAFIFMLVVMVVATAAFIPMLVVVIVAAAALVFVLVVVIVTAAALFLMVVMMAAATARAFFFVVVMVMTAAAAGALIVMLVMMVTATAFVIIVVVMAAVMFKLQRDEGCIDMRHLQAGRGDDVFQLRIGSDGKSVITGRSHADAAGQQGMHGFAHHVDVAADFGNVFCRGVNDVEVTLFVYQHVAHFQRLFQLERIGERIAGGGLEFLGRLFAF